MLKLLVLFLGTVGCAVISNTEIRMDAGGVPLNAHQGSMIEGQGEWKGTYFYYGGHLANCSTNETKCRCHGTSATYIWDAIAIYASTDLSVWDLRSVEHRGGSLEPRVVFNKKTQEYVMIYLMGSDGCRLTMATSSSPIGPFKKQGCFTMSWPLMSDYNAFVDQKTGDGYFVYTVGKNMLVEQMDDAFSGTVASTRYVIPHNYSCVEAPLMFERKGIYYVLFGTCCWCCPQGSEVFVWMATHPLGPYTVHGDINEADGSRVVSGQSCGVVPVQTTQGTEIMWMSDEWQSAPLWSADKQYWDVLQFDDDGTILPLQWHDTVTINVSSR